MNTRATTSQAVEMAFACEVLAHPMSDGLACLAKLYGLRGPDSLQPWQMGETSDVRDIARRDFEPEFGGLWEEEWDRRRDEACIILEGRLGKEWPTVLRTRLASELQSDKVH